MRSTTALPSASSMSLTRTDAPPRARVSAQASPMPEAPPVTMATLPESWPIGSAALEVADALLGVGFYALLEVLGLARPVLLGELALGRFLGAVGEAAAHGLARRQERERRRLRALLGEIHRPPSPAGQRA